ncbi:MAG: hypothetical protein QOG64_577, partial [Acidimicrobiaceae bacterium]|nr:hypothetical protein [Acidimicrobiaceae bacterium]
MSLTGELGRCEAGAAADPWTGAVGVSIVSRYAWLIFRSWSLGAPSGAAYGRGMDILLIAGLWLDGSAWNGVVGPLEGYGHRTVPLTLPGQGDKSSSATLEAQIAAVLAAVDAVAGHAVVVGHSAAATLAWIAADA